MPTLAKSSNKQRTVTLRRTSANTVLEALDQLCSSLGTGGRIPNRAELMRRFDASERAVLQALDELNRRGRIVRRVGAGTFVSGSPDSTSEGPVLASPVDSRTVVAITEPDKAFFTLGVELLHRHAEGADLSLVCRLTDARTQLRFVDSAQLGNPLGFILFRYSLAPLAKQLQEMGHRVVMIGAPPADVTAEFPCIHGDHEYGAYLATKHLIDLGHRQIAFALPGDDLNQSLRWLGHQQAIRDAEREGHHIDATILSRKSLDSFNEDPSRAAAFFGSSTAPTGLVVWNDHEATLLLSVLSNAGVRVPSDVSIVGYDNLPEGALVTPKLTTVDQGLGQQLRVALRILTRPVPPPTSHLVLMTPTLVSRDSTAHPRRERHTSSVD